MTISNSKMLLAALAIGAIPTSAWAQASVTAWGIFDAGYSQQSDRSGGLTGQLAQISSGAWQASRIHLRGSLELTPDLTGVAETGTSINLSNGQFSVGANSSAVTVETNTTGSTTTVNSLSTAGRLFDRIAYVGISSKTFGTLTFGRQPTVLHDTMVVTDPLRANNGATNLNLRLAYLCSPGTLANGKVLVNNFGPNPAINRDASANGLDRQDNTIKYVYRNSGFVGETYYAFGGVAGTMERNNSKGALVGYDGNGLVLRASMAQFKDGLAIPFTAYTTGAGYTIGNWKFMATVSENKVDDAAYLHVKTDIDSVAVRYAFTPKLDVMVQASSGQRLHQRGQAGRFHLGADPLSCHDHIMDAGQELQSLRHGGDVGGYRCSGQVPQLL